MSSFKFLKPFVLSEKPTVLFNKSGLSSINNVPNIVMLNEDKNLIKKGEKDWEEVKNYWLNNPGESIKINNRFRFEIINITLVRLDNISEHDALATGLKANEENQYKHYCPELLYPKKVLQDQKPGFPFYSTAKGSFYSLWMKNYGIADIYKNPWVWKYEIRIL